MKGKIAAMLYMCVCTISHDTAAYGAKTMALEPDSTRVDFKTTLPDSLKSAVVEAVRFYGDTYGCISQVAICEDTTELTKIRQDGSNEVILAHALPGAIYINKKAWINRARIRNIIKREMFHAIAPRGPLYFKQSYLIYNDAYEVVGYKGLSLMLISRKLAVISDMKLVEEAAAEVCALELEKGYTTSSMQYFYIGSFLRNMVDSGWVTPQQLIQMQKTNDYPAFCALFCNKKEPALTPDDLGLVVDCFFRIANGNGYYDPFLKFLSRMHRKE